MKNTYTICSEEHAFTSEEKLKWCGYGEWVEEPDFVEFEYMDYKGKVVRMFVREPNEVQESWFGGHLCGYVEIPKDHPYFGLDESKMELDCHLGLTFSECEDKHWIGFDCAHLGDKVPTMHLVRTRTEVQSFISKFQLPEGFQELSLFNTMYRNMQYCIDTCIHMIDQLINFRVKNMIEKSAAAAKKYDEDN